MSNFLYSNLPYHQMLLLGLWRYLMNQQKLGMHISTLRVKKTFVLYIYLGNIDLLLQLLYKVDIREIQKGSNKRLQTFFFFSLTWHIMPKHKTHERFNESSLNLWNVFFRFHFLTRFWHTIVLEFFRNPIRIKVVLYDSHICTWKFYKIDKTIEIFRYQKSNHYFLIVFTY